MRVTLLAASMVCVTALPLSAQTAKMDADAGSVVTVALSPASEAAWTRGDVVVVEPMDATPMRAAELKPQLKLTKLKVQAVRLEPLKTANTQALELVRAGSRVAQVTEADVQETRMDPSPSPLLRIAYVQASKMNPAAALGLTGVMRYTDSPWLDHAINDLGTNPTGWKRVWCARSMTMWLQRSGKRGCPTDAAISCLAAGERLEAPKVGAIAVLKNHVGIVKEIQDRHVVLVSGNNRGKPGARKVGISKFARATIVGYVWPE
jgi:hypothetical protein